MVAGLTWSSQTWWLKRACETRVLRWFGRYSYAGYVIHFPLMYLLLGRWVRIFGPTRLALSSVTGRMVFTCVSLCASSGLAYASWFGIEQPFLRMKRFFDYRDGSLRFGRAGANEQATSRPLAAGGALGLAGLGESTIGESPDRATHERRGPE